MPYAMLPSSFMVQSIPVHGRRVPELKSNSHTLLLFGFLYTFTWSSFSCTTYSSDRDASAGCNCDADPIRPDIPNPLTFFAYYVVSTFMLVFTTTVSLKLNIRPSFPVKP